MKATCSQCHTAGCSRHLRPIAGGIPHLPSRPHLLKWAPGCFQFLPPELLTGWFCCFRNWNYDALLDPQSPGAGVRAATEDKFCAFVLFFIYWSYRHDLYQAHCSYVHWLCRHSCHTPVSQVETDCSFLLLFHALPHFLRIGRHFLFVCLGLCKGSLAGEHAYDLKIKTTF